MQWLFSLLVVSYIVASVFVYVAEKEEGENEKIYPVTMWKGMVIGIGLVYLVLNLFKLMF